MKIAICGHGRHGKDTFSKMLAQRTSLIFSQSTSEYAASIVYENLGFSEGSGYASVRECWEDRANRRSEWSKIIWEYNKTLCPKYGVKGIFLYSEMIESNDIIVGIRDPEELMACNSVGMFEFTAYVDASDRVELESKSSNRIEAKDCDIVVNNNKGKDHLEREAERLASLINLHIRLSSKTRIS